MVVMGSTLAGLAGVALSMVTNVARYGIWKTLWTCRPEKLESLLLELRLEISELPSNILIAMHQSGLVRWLETQNPEPEQISAEQKESESARLCGREPMLTSLAFAAKGPEELAELFRPLVNDLRVFQDWVVCCAAACWMGSKMLLTLRAYSGRHHEILDSHYHQLAQELRNADHLVGFEAKRKDLEAKFSDMKVHDLLVRFEDKLQQGNPETLAMLHIVFENFVGEWLLVNLAGVRAASLKPWTRVLCSNFCEPVCLHVAAELRITWKSIA